MTKKIPPPPDGLSERAQKMWMADKRSRSVGRLALLEQCLRALDRAEQFRQMLAGQELLTITPKSGAAHLSPLVKAETEARDQFARLAKTLGLDWDDDVDGGVNR